MMISPGLVGVANNSFRAEGGSIKSKCSFGFFLVSPVSAVSNMLYVSSNVSDKLTHPMSPPSSLVSAQLLSMDAICSNVISAEVNFSRL